MNIIKAHEYKPNTAWDSMLISQMEGMTIKLHWTDKPYKWHTNDGEEVFVVLDGTVRMHYKIDDIVNEVVLKQGDIFHASLGTEHFAEPITESRILVIEKEGSI